MNHISVKLRTGSREKNAENTCAIQIADDARLRISPTLDEDHRSELGQFMTPSVIAGFMASLFPDNFSHSVSILDAGAGVGSLSAALLARLKGISSIRNIDVTTYELDARLRAELELTLSRCSNSDSRVAFSSLSADFIESAVNEIQFNSKPTFTHAIINPPYRKINVGSVHRKLLSEVGIETVNLYSAFVALTLKLMRPGGEVVAIIPRSFCNGPYYKPFRDLMFRSAALRQIHLFDSRTSAFSDDSVLQENVIIRMTVGEDQGQVTISRSSDKTLFDLQKEEHEFSSVVLPNDSERFLHLPKIGELQADRYSAVAKFDLAEIGLKVSTGPVVDFRLKDFLQAEPNEGTVPLLYANHFVKGKLVWPRPEGKKANAIQLNAETTKWLYPNGSYTLLRRFSSKEERRRIVAYVVDGSEFGSAKYLGFENHLNLFHENRQPLRTEIAHGLSVYLNSTVVDDYFRRFSGHTQVNATDLRNLKYPHLDDLVKMGRWALKQDVLSQEAIDKHIGKYER